MSQGTVVGFARALIFFTDSSGRHIGQSATLANGSTSGAYVATKPVTSGYTAPAAVSIDLNAGDKTYGRAQFGNALTPSFDMTLNDYDTALIATISGSTVNTSNSKITVASDNPNLTSPYVLGLALQSRLQQADGTNYWLTHIFPKCQMRIKRGGPAFQAVAPTTISVTPQMTTYAITGQVFASTGLNMNLEGDQADNYHVITANPIHYVTQKSDAAATTVNLIYKPLTTTITLNAAENNMWKNGTATALSACTLAGVATLAAAGTAGDVHVIQHETNYVGV